MMSTMYSTICFEADGTMIQVAHASEAVSNSKLGAFYKIGSRAYVLVEDAGSKFDLKNRVVVVSDNILLMSTGVSSDGLYCLTKAKQIAKAWSDTYSVSIPVFTLLKKLMLFVHEISRLQNAIMGCELLLCSSDGLYKINPIGSITQTYYTVASGRNSNNLPKTEYNNGLDLIKNLKLSLPQSISLAEYELSK
jgi:20S proteasome alpha/beta subunit